MCERISGVGIRVLQNDQPITIENDGFLDCPSEGQLLLRVVVMPGYGIFGFTVDGNKSVIAKRNLADGPTSCRLYQLKIPIRQGDRDECYTAYPGNNLRLVEQLDGEADSQFETTGAVRIWEIAVISQYGVFFLSIQRTYYAECFLDERGGRIYPRFKKWSQMNEFLVSLLPGNVMPQQALSSFETELEPPRNGLSGNNGRVLWFNRAQGFGALVTSSGVVRVHWSQVEGRPRQAYLEEGEKVSFAGLRTPQRTNSRGTSFKLEACGVALL